MTSTEKSGPLAQQIAQVREALQPLGSNSTQRANGRAALSVIERHVQDMEKALDAARLVADMHESREGFQWVGSEDEQLRHLNGDKCDNRAVNLSWGTAKENADDRESHGRTAYGERNGYATLTAEQIAEIRRRYLTGEGNQYELADEFGVHQTHIGRIVRGTRRARG